MLAIYKASLDRSKVSTSTLCVARCGYLATACRYSRIKLLQFEEDPGSANPLDLRLPRGLALALPRGLPHCDGGVLRSCGESCDTILSLEESVANFLLGEDAGEDSGLILPPSTCCRTFAWRVCDAKEVKGTPAKFKPSEQSEKLSPN